MEITTPVGSTTPRSTYSGMFELADIDLSFTSEYTEPFSGPNCDVVTIVTTTEETLPTNTTEESFATDTTEEFLATRSSSTADSEMTPPATSGSTESSPGQFSLEALVVPVFMVCLSIIIVTVIVILGVYFKAKRNAKEDAPRIESHNLDIDHLYESIDPLHQLDIAEGSLDKDPFTSRRQNVAYNIVADQQLDNTRIAQDSLDNDLFTGVQNVAYNAVADRQMDNTQDSLNNDHFTGVQYVPYNAVVQSTQNTENGAENHATNGDPVSQSNEDDTYY